MVQVIQWKILGIQDSKLFRLFLSLGENDSRISNHIKFSNDVSLDPRKLKKPFFFLFVSSFLGLFWHRIKRFEVVSMQYNPRLGTKQTKTPSI